MNEPTLPPHVRFHGTSSVRWASIQADGLLRKARFGDQHVSLTDDIEVARYWTQMACSTDEGATPVVLRVDTTGLPTEPFSSVVWGDGECDWESETACMVDVPIDRVTVHEFEPVVVPTVARAVRYDKNTHRIQRGDEIVALAQRVGNDRWVLNDMHDRRMNKATYAKPKDVAAAFEKMSADGKAESKTT